MAAGPGATVLIVDDDASIRKVARLRLEQEGFRVIVAQNGEEGLGLAKSGAPDVILLDIKMPGMDGREVLRRLKVSSDTQHIPVILLTVIGSHDELSSSIGPGYEFHLSKPYNPDMLLEAIRSVLKKK